MSVIAQAIPDGSDFLKTFLTAGIAGAGLLAAMFGYIFFKPERAQLIATIDDLRKANERYVEIHHTTTIPTLTKALSLLETVEQALTALTKAWEEQARANADLSRRLELLERQLDVVERRIQ